MSDDPITPAQIRAARGLLHWRQGDLSTAAGIPVHTISQIESERRPARRRTLDAIRQALEAHGIRWIGKTGVDCPDG